MKINADRVISLFESLSQEEKAKVLRHLESLSPGYRFTPEAYDRMVEQLEQRTLDVAATKRQHYVRTT